MQLQYSGDNDQSGVFTVFRAVRLFKLFKLIKGGDLSLLIDSISFTITSIKDYIFLLMLFIYIFSLIGMSFFASQLKFNPDTDMLDIENGVSPRNNFDSMLWALMTIFQVLLGDGWNLVMYDVMRSGNQGGALYFVFLVLMGNIIMLNLFLAILLGNFEKARNYRQKKIIFEAFQLLFLKGRTLNRSLDFILGDQSMVIKKRILKWDENMVN